MSAANVVVTVFMCALLTPWVIEKLKLWIPMFFIEFISISCVLGMSGNWNPVAHSVKNPILLGKF